MKPMNLTLAKTTSVPDELAAALAALERGGAITPVSLKLNDPTISYDAWVGVGEVISRVRRASSWWIGDWYIFGGRNYGEDRAQAAEHVTGLNSHTLATIVRTCMYVPRGRRILSLPFSLHTEVCRLMPEEQTLWLQRAARGDGRDVWTRQQLRDAIRFSNGREQSEPRWQGAIEMQRVNELEKIAREVYTRALPGEGQYVLVERELMARLGSALGLEEA